ncbi:MAG: hypothetical protein WB626_09510 [Bacteroidota bacterium]
MVRSSVLCAGMVFLVVLPLRSEEPPPGGPVFIRATIQQSEASLAYGLGSPSPGLQLTAAQTLRQLKELFPGRSFTSTVIPLLALLKREETETPVRLVAALALHDLRTERGDYAIARMAHHADCPRLRHLCGWLAYYRLAERAPAPSALEQVRRLVAGAIPEPLPERFPAAGEHAGSVQGE